MFQRRDEKRKEEKRKEEKEKEKRKRKRKEEKENMWINLPSQIVCNGLHQCFLSTSGRPGQATNGRFLSYAPTSSLYL